MNLQRLEPEEDENGNPIHKTDGEAIAFIRDNMPERKDFAEIIIESYWMYRASGLDVNESRHRAIAGFASIIRIFG